VGIDKYGPPPSGDPREPGGPVPTAGPPQVRADHPAQPPFEAPASFAVDGPARKDKNWLGVASLIAGLLGALPLSIGLGIGGLRAAKDRRANNRPVAIVGLVASVAAPIVYTVLALNYFGLSDKLAEKSVSYKDLAKGDCVLEPGGWNDTGGVLETNHLKVVPCVNDHWGQVYYIKAVQDATYPGDAAMDAKSVEFCESDEAIKNVKKEHWPDMTYGSLLPTADSWFDFRSVLCILMPESGTLTQSWLVGQ